MGKHFHIMLVRRRIQNRFDRLWFSSKFGWSAGFIGFENKNMHRNSFSKIWEYFALNSCPNLLSNNTFIILEPFLVHQNSFKNKNNVSSKFPKMRKQNSMEPASVEHEIHAVQPTKQSISCIKSVLFH